MRRKPDEENGDEARRDHARAPLASLSVARANETPENEDFALLRMQTQALLDAVAPGERSLWRRHLHEKPIHVDENGVLRNKRQLVEEISP